jgi:TRAP-type C4-dicarboxylate transport system permease small subunit
MKSWAFLHSKIFGTVEWTTKMLLILLALTTVVQVFSRIIHVSIMWTVELSRFIYPWMGFLGIVVAAERDEIPRFTVFADKLKGRTRKFFFGIIDSVILLFLGTLLIASWPVLLISNAQRMSLLPMPWSYVYASLTVTLCLMIVLYIEKIVKLFSRKE